MKQLRQVPSVGVGGVAVQQNITDSEMKEFLKTIATVTDEGCWVTNYYKPVNAKGQARLRYKNKKIYLYQLSHLLFNSDVSNLDSIFHNCSNLICFNPTHLTDDLKEKQFKERMSSKELMEGCPTEKDKKKILIGYGNWLSKELERSLVQDDFLVAGRISATTIKKYFGSLSNYFNECDFLPAQRKPKMTDSEMKEFLKNIAVITENGCWETDYWKTSNLDGRIQIQYKGKLQFLSRVSYTLFKGSISDGLVVTHSCDNPRCYNSDHLVTDTQKGNMKQAVERGRIVSTSKKRKHHGIKNAYDNEILLNFVKQHIKITEKDEWIFDGGSSQRYPTIMINRKLYQLHRLILANKLGKKYDEINGDSCHILPDGSRPDKRDINPDHLFEGTHRENSLQAAKYSKSYKLDKDKATQVRDAAAKFDFSKRGSKRRFDKKWAAKLDVSRDCIRGVRSGKTWNA